jgi:hypothetical protein
MLLDLNYVKYYPWDKKYISLFAKTTTEMSKQQLDVMRRFVQDIAEKRTSYVPKHDSPYNSDSDAGSQDMINDPLFSLSN